MNFLRFKQVSAIKFVLKTIFYKFLVLSIIRTGRTNTGKGTGLGERITSHRPHPCGLRVDS
jgi:hypothetical protein